MDWRCEWCGKPHEENDPPCDNCGHATFEEAVVRRTDLADDGPESTTVWVCTECDRTHTKHSPPCSRCGNHKLVKEEQRVDDDELSVPSYLDLLTPRYVLGLVVVLALAGVFVGGLTGVIDVPGFGNDVPTVENVPGDAESAGDIGLTGVERAYLDEFDGVRAGAGMDNLTRDERLDEIATFVNQHRVKEAYGDGNGVPSDPTNSLIDDRCDGQVFIDETTLQSGNYTSATEFGNAFAESLGGETGPAEATSVGVDTHTAPDGTVYLLVLAC